jgi:excisionase family DNA binding protein
MIPADISHLISNLLIVGWFSVAGAAAYCSTSKRTIEMWIKEEGLRVTRIRGKRLIKKEWLDEFLERHESGNGKKVDEIVDQVMESIT